MCSCGLRSAWLHAHPAPEAQGAGGGGGGGVRGYAITAFSCFSLNNGDALVVFPRYSVMGNEYE